MTYSMMVGKYKLIFSDTHFKDFRKKPTISVYDADTNSETKIASFNSQETFEWFVEAVAEADRKTENSSEKPNNCEHITEDGVTCVKYPACDDCLDNPLNKVKGSERLVKGSEQTDCLDRYDHKTEPTISKMEQVETMSCAECKHRPIGAEICEEPCHYEPQTDWHYDEQDATWYPYKHEDEPQQKSCATCKHALGNWDGESNNCGRCCGSDRRFYEPKDESQTEREGE